MTSMTKNQQPSSPPDPSNPPKRVFQSAYSRLNCLGYYGFGLGYEGAREKARTGSIDGAKGTCNACVVSDICLLKHANRVREIFPETAAHIDARIKECGGDEDALRATLVKDGLVGDRDPFYVVYIMNGEDGYAVYRDGWPCDRGQHTIRWPFGAGN